MLNTAPGKAVIVVGIGKTNFKGNDMPGKNTRSLQVLTDWNSREYVNEGQKAATLQVLINSALEEQNRLTRRECTRVVLRLANRNGGHPSVFSSEFAEVCESVEAL